MTYLGGCLFYQHDCCLPAAVWWERPLVPQYQYVMSQYTHFNTTITSHHSSWGCFPKYLHPRILYSFPTIATYPNHHVLNWIPRQWTLISLFVKMFSTPIILHLCVLQDSFVYYCRLWCCESNLIIQYLLDVWIIWSQYVFSKWQTEEWKTNFVGMKEWKIWKI